MARRQWHHSAALVTGDCIVLTCGRWTLPRLDLQLDIRPVRAELRRRGLMLVAAGDSLPFPAGASVPSQSWFVRRRARRGRRAALSMNNGVHHARTA